MKGSLEKNGKKSDDKDEHGCFGPRDRRKCREDGYLENRHKTYQFMGHPLIPPQLLMVGFDIGPHSDLVRLNRLKSFLNHKHLFVSNETSFIALKWLK